MADELLPLDWEAATVIARRAIYDLDNDVRGRGMIGGNRRFLQDRVARAILKDVNTRAADRRGDDEAAWLIEWNEKTSIKYWTLDDGEQGAGFCGDVNRALRFARKQDAQAYIDDIGWNSPDVFASEHMWCEPTKPLKTQRDELLREAVAILELAETAHEMRHDHWKQLQYRDLCKAVDAERELFLQRARDAGLVEGE